MSPALKSAFLYTAGWVCACTLLLIPQLTAGQISEGLQGANLVVSRALPEPNSTVTVSLSAYSMDISGAEITWYIDGVEQTEYKNERSIDVILGNIGETSEIRVVVASSRTIPFSVTKTITPTAIDLIIETDTNIPVFYKGRALPGQGSPLRVTALVFDGSNRNPSEFTYTWELNHKVLFGGPIKGKSTAEITMPDYRNALLTIEVTAPDGSTVGKRNINLSGTEPELYFYQGNPLRGMSRKAVGEILTLIGEETTVRAEPYFIDQNLNNDTAHYEWRINGALIENTNDDPYSVTLRTTGGEGTARVSFKAVNIRQLSQYVEDSFTVLFE